MSEYRVPHGVAWVEVGEDDEALDPEAVVARVPEGPPLALRGPSALIWFAALEGGTEDDVVSRVVHTSGQPATVVAGDVRDLLARLVALGLLAHD